MNDRPDDRCPTCASPSPKVRLPVSAEPWTDCPDEWHIRSPLGELCAQQIHWWMEDNR